MPRKQSRIELAISRYRLRYQNVPAFFVDKDGVVTSGTCPCVACAGDGVFLASLVKEGLRWGEAAMAECPHGFCLWSAPVTDNNELVGGLISGNLMPESGNEVGLMGSAARYLLRVAVECNLTNEALIALNAEEAAREASKAQAIHTLKGGMYSSVRQVFLQEEVNLVIAVKTGERGQAREILNRILVGVYSLAGQDFELLKALVLELVVVIYRTAVEAGGDPLELLGLNYTSFQLLAQIGDEERLTHWLVSHLEKLMDSIYVKGDRPVEAQLQAALKYMQDHCADDISRDEVAQAAFLSPSYLSHMLKKRLNKGYAELLNEMRLGKARALLLRTNKRIIDVAVESGFTDQSYFTRVFKKHIGMTPKEYRGKGGY